MHRLRSDCASCHRIDPERSERIINAVLANMGSWEERVAEIEQDAPPSYKVKALSLMRDLHMARVSLRRLVGLPET